MIRNNFLFSIFLLIVIIPFLSLSIPISVVCAYTEIVASTNTELYVSDTNTTVLRLIPTYKVETSDLTFEANAKITTVINNNGSASIEEKYAAWAVKSGPRTISGAVVSNSYSATNVTEIKTNMSTETVVKKGKYVVRTSVSGISLASPGPNQTDADYELTLSGSHVVKTTGVAAGRGSTTDDEFERIRISFETCPREMDPPAEVKEEIKVSYNYVGGELDIYGYDYSNEVKANDITCTSSMIYMKGGGG